MRLYRSAQKVLEQAGVDPDSVEIEGTGKGGAVTKSDAEAFVAAQTANGKPAASDSDSDGRPPTQADIIRAGLVEGLSDEEILKRVRAVHPNTKKTVAAARQQLRWEQKQDSAWWQEHAQAVKRHRPDAEVVN